MIDLSLFTFIFYLSFLCPPPPPPPPPCPSPEQPRVMQMVESTTKWSNGPYLFVLFTSPIYKPHVWYSDLGESFLCFLEVNNAYQHFKTDYSLELPPHDLYWGDKIKRGGFIAQTKGYLWIKNGLLK